MRIKPLQNTVLSPAVARAIAKKFSKAKAESVRLFLRQFYANTSKSELLNASVNELLTPVLSAWDFVQHRASRLPQITFSEYTSAKDDTGTCILILVDDMPFLVDSIWQGLNRAGTR
jgi:NAD-specific glutamate dehydrogenase